MFLAAVAFTAMAAFVRQLSKDLSGLDIVFYRSLIHLGVVLSVLVAKRRDPLRELSATVLIRSLLGFIAVTCFFLSVGSLDVGLATLIQFTAPVFTTLFAAMLLKERVRLTHWGCLLLAMAGVMLASGAGMGSFRACFMSLLGACAAGVSYGLLSKASTKTSEESLQFWFSTTALAGSFSTIGTNLAIPSPGIFPALIAVGICVTVYQYSVTRAYKSGPASSVAPLSLLPSVLTPFVQGISGGTWPTSAQWTGTALTVCSVAMLTRRSILPISIRQPQRRKMCSQAAPRDGR